MHADEADAPDAANEVPAPQLTQLAAPVVVWYDPEPQLMHAVAAWPAEKAPATQLTQPVEPVAAWYVPKPQLLQVAEPVLPWNCPVAHPAHAAPPAVA